VPELDVLLKAIFLVITKTMKTKKKMSWKPWNHQFLWRLQIELPAVGPKMEIFNPIHTHQPILRLTKEVQS